MLQPYHIESPAIPSGGLYSFVTTSGLEYEVRFARKKDNILNVTVAFGVVNEEYEGEEYVVTNRGEVFKVMATIATVVQMYLIQHPNVRIVEFTGEPKQFESEDGSNKRIKLYQRYLPQIFDTSLWKFKLTGNHMVCSRKD